MLILIYVVISILEYMYISDINIMHIVVFSQNGGPGFKSP